ncbi:ABC transporter [Rhizobium sp. 58]|nr:ABC transporter [Rhizobium sp. 58]
MATGLIALLDDVAAIAKLAAASLDDVAAQTAKATTKAAGIVIDDAAVTPRYVVGLSPARELPIIGRIALGSLKNKLVFLLPAALLLGYFASWVITPLLMVGGIYLCYEGAEKLYAVFFPHAAHGHEKEVLGEETDPVALENQKVSGAVRTDFILSAEIMALTLADVSETSIYIQAFVLAAVGILITLAVYGFVALIVKADDAGIAMAKTSSSMLQVVGRGLVYGMPIFLKLLAAVGTAAMLWVGGSILVHGLAQLGFPGPEHVIHDLSAAVVTFVSFAPAIVGWFATSALQALLAIAIGAIAVAAMGNLIAPLWKLIRGQR